MRMRQWNTYTKIIIWSEHNKGAVSNENETVPLLSFSRCCSELPFVDAAEIAEVLKAAHGGDLTDTAVRARQQGVRDL